MPQSKKPAWMQEEDDRADDQAEKGGVVNENAPKLVRRKDKAPPRMQKALFIQEKHAAAFDRLVFEQKMTKGKKSPELAEEAFELLLKKYNIKL